MGKETRTIFSRDASINQKHVSYQIHVFSNIIADTLQKCTDTLHLHILHRIAKLQS